MRSFAYTIALAAIAAAAPLPAQQFERGSDRIPPGHRPPPGMCRIWVEGVPPGRQPAPTDCATAVRNRPANGRVIFGDDAAHPGRGKGRAGSDARDRDDDKRRGGDKRDRDDDKRRGGDTRDRDDDKRRGDVARNRDDDDARRDRDDRDDARRAAGICIDRDRDGRCDDLVLPRGRYPSTLPEMIGTSMIESGRRSPDQLAWLGQTAEHARYVDADDNGIPERVTWLSRRGEILQVWLDTNRDGRADVVELYSDGRRVGVIR